MVDALKTKANLISEQLKPLEQEIARLPPSSQTGGVKGHGTVDQRDSGSSETVPENQSREALTAMLFHARAAIRGKPFTPLSREHATALREIRIAQEEAAAEIDDGHFGSQALVKLVRGLKALEGTELEGIIPKEYVHELEDRWRSKLQQASWQDVSVLTGEKKIRLVGDEEARSLAQIFGDLDQKPIANLLANVAGAAICTSCGQGGCTHGRQIRDLNESGLSALKLALQSLEETSVHRAPQLDLVLAYTKEVTEHLLNMVELGAKTLQQPRSGHHSRL